MRRTPISRQTVFLGCAMVLILSGLYCAVKVALPTPGSHGAPETALADPAQDSEPLQVSSEEILKHTQGTRAVIPPARTLAKRAKTPSELAAASSRAKELVTQITQIDLSQGPITAEQAEKWKQALGELAEQGAAAVPAIHEFLEKNEDVAFDLIRGGRALGQTSIRTALINTLQQIGGPEAIEAMAQTMAVTAVPSEVALLGNYLDQQAPGQYRQQALSAAQAVLGIAAQGQLPGYDIGTLLQMTQNFDPTAVAATAEKLEPQYRFYAAIALAGLQDGAGLPALLQDLQNPAQGTRSDVVYQMLAQVAAQYPKAGAALLQQARQGQIPESAWPRIASGLGGDQYAMFGFAADGRPEIPNVAGLKLYHMDSGNQNFYSLPITAVMSPDQVGLRQNLIDQLLATKPAPDAVQALQQARANLSGTVAQRSLWPFHQSRKTL